uniref:Reverse transcriptase (RNA-dependent DNA polymerase) n=1 Tax=Candidatus Kentrum sp. SD TaxID=2126332 RepID=A0A450YQD8_9GAMM|nr:MAG: hypothetical protein BECKSD772F_GA0070984_101425 [Candidatus Kentron sp. SD]VFK43758.1 MAG: hypothetical protein BECKSD772E_GA0070983_10298 [Candidatus Kentron sp. SD]VFK78733.1 MAG: hypothetical protein BECKSD772D_GA0070982_102318 [Candidatus Kentron sp. SD]
MGLKCKVHSLTGRITPKRMREALKNVKRNQGAAGIDKVSVQMFEANLDENLDALMRDLKTRGKFQPKPLRRVFIPKGKGKMRPLGIPAVRDRIEHDASRRQNFGNFVFPIHAQEVLKISVVAYLRTSVP